MLGAVLISFESLPQQGGEAARVRLEQFETASPFDKLHIVTIQQILDGERINLPLMEEVTKKAQKAKTDDQPSLLVE